MSAVKTSYSIESEPTEKDKYELKITKTGETVIVTVIHTKYDGGAKTSSEGIIIPLDDFKELIDEIWRGN